jgi:hypothetical protein
MRQGLIEKLDGALCCLEAAGMREKSGKRQDTIYLETCQKLVDRLIQNLCVIGDEAPQLPVSHGDPRSLASTTLTTAALEAKALHRNLDQWIPEIHARLAPAVPRRLERFQLTGQAPGSPAKRLTSQAAIALNDATAQLAASEADLQAVWHRMVKLQLHWSDHRAHKQLVKKALESDKEIQEAHTQLLRARATRGLTPSQDAAHSTLSAAQERVKQACATVDNLTREFEALRQSKDARLRPTATHQELRENVRASVDGSLNEFYKESLSRNSASQSLQVTGTELIFSNTGNHRAFSHYNDILIREALSNIQEQGNNSLTDFYLQLRKNYQKTVADGSAGIVAMAALDSGQPDPETRLFLQKTLAAAILQTAAQMRPPVHIALDHTAMLEALQRRVREGLKGEPDAEFRKALDAARQASGSTFQQKFDGLCRLAEYHLACAGQTRHHAQLRDALLQQMRSPDQGNPLQRLHADFMQAATDPTSGPGPTREEAQALWDQALVQCASDYASAKLQNRRPDVRLDRDLAPHAVNTLASSIDWEGVLSSMRAALKLQVTPPASPRSA